MKLTIQLFFIFIFAENIPSQNLILNPSFEKIAEKIEAPIEWEMTAWSPDYYSLKLSKTSFNSAEYLTPFGDSYIGMLECECISTKLSSALIKDRQYIITVYVAKPNHFCPSGIKKITVAFTKGKLPRKDGVASSYYAIKYIPLYSEDFKPIRKTQQWEAFSAIYKAKGDEVYFHIGDFGKALTSTGKKPNEGENILEIDSLNMGKCSQIYYDNVSVELSPFQKNIPIAIDSIFFANNKSELLPISYQKLDKLYALLIKLNTKKVKIIGHTDNGGDKIKNKSLSQQRANSVVNYLIKKGIPKSKLIAAGMGDTKPIANNDTEEGKAKNRRVEIELLD